MLFGKILNPWIDKCYLGSLESGNIELTNVVWENFRNHGLLNVIYEKLETHRLKNGNIELESFEIMDP